MQPYGLYDCADGQIVISVQNDREWARFCRLVLEDDALVDDPRFNTMPGRVANLAALNTIIAPVFAKLTRATLAPMLRKADIAYGALNTVADLSKHPQFRRVAQPTERGEVALVASPIRGGPTPARYKPIPALDEHGAALRREFAA